MPYRRFNYAIHTNYSCLNCTKHEATCHATCPHYKSESEEHQQAVNVVKQQRAKDKQMTEYIHSRLGK